MGIPNTKDFKNITNIQDALGRNLSLSHYEKEKKRKVIFFVVV